MHAHALAPRRLSSRSSPVVATAAATTTATTGRDGSGPTAIRHDPGRPERRDGRRARAVTLKGVVVTAIDNYGGKTGDFWVEEPDGGAFSGVHVFGAPLDQVAALAVGDVVDITGAQKDEFALIDGDTLGQHSSPSSSPLAAAR